MKVKPISEHAQDAVQMDGAHDVRMRMLIGAKDGADNFHMRHFEVAPGGYTPHHRHDYEHEVLILRGDAVVVGPDRETPAGAGAVVFIPANEKHQFRNAGSEPLEFICLIPAPHQCS